MSLAENRMHTCPGYDEESRKCGVMREEKKSDKKKAEKGAAAQKKHTNSLPHTRNQINLKMMNRMRKRSNRDY